MTGSDGHPAILDVVEHDQCIACGACVSACPNDAVAPVFHLGRGAHEVAIVDAQACIGCPAPCDDVCPSLQVDLRELLGDRVPDDQPVARVGPVEEVLLAASPEHRDNGVSSSGGIVRALIVAALAEGTPVVCLADDNGTQSVETLLDPDDIDRVPGSIYHSVSFAGAIEALAAAPRPALLVSTPCQLEGIVGYIHRVDPSLEDRIALRVGLICGWMYTHHSLTAFQHYKGVEGDVTAAAYRGEDEAGRLKLTIDGVQHDWSRREFATTGDRLDYQASFSRYANRARCRVCEDHLNVLADIAVGDAWLERKQGEKLSIVVLRTPTGRRAFEQLAQSGAIEVESGTIDDIRESQSDRLVDGDEARALGAWLREGGAVSPVFDFGDGAEALLTRSDRASFRWEWMLRGLLRSGRHATFRRLYAGRAASRRVVGAVRRVVRSSR